MDARAQTALHISGRYVIFHEGVECGEERWTLEATPERAVVTGEQALMRPHPFPSAQSYRATLTPDMRLRGLEIVWSVGDRRLRALHEASGERWRVRIEYGGEVREQEGDYPAACEVEYTTHLSNMFILSRRDFQIGGEHEFPVLRIGPPWMAVTPERMRIRCVERATVPSPLGPRTARRYVISLPPHPEAEGYTFWADDEGVVLESFGGPEPGRPWMRLVEYRRSL